MLDAHGGRVTKPIALGQCGSNETEKKLNRVVIICQTRALPSHNGQEPYTDQRQGFQPVHLVESFYRNSRINSELNGYVGDGHAKLILRVRLGVALGVRAPVY